MPYTEIRLQHEGFCVSVVKTLGTVFLGVKPFFFVAIFDGGLGPGMANPKRVRRRRKRKTGELKMPGPKDASLHRGALCSRALLASRVMCLRSLVQEKKPEDRSARNGGSEAEVVRTA